MALLPQIQLQNNEYLATLPQSYLSGNELPVMEHFYTLQGEGFFALQPAYFIRLAGCNVGCVWCDVKESWSAQDYPLMPIQSLVNETLTNKATIVVITGGEPLMHPLTELCKALKKANKRTHLETSGSYPISGSWDWICLSPKKMKPPLPEIVPLAHELKMVIFNATDFQWAEKYAQQTNPQCKLYLQPEWSKAAELLPLIIEYVKNNPTWAISLQTHKYINIP